MKICLAVGLETVQPSHVVLDLGVWLDSELSLRQRVTKIATSSCDDSCQVHRCAGCEVTAQLVLALVIFKLDYCNSVLSGFQSKH